MNLILALLSGIAMAVPVPVDLTSAAFRHHWDAVTQSSEVELIGGSANWPPERRRGRRKGWMKR